MDRLLAIKSLGRHTQKPCAIITLRQCASAAWTTRWSTTFYAQEEELRVDTLSIQQDSLFTRHADNMIPLTAEEVKAHETLDSSMTVDKIFKPTGFLTRFLDSEEKKMGRVGKFAKGGMSKRGDQKR